MANDNSILSFVHDYNINRNWFIFPAPQNSKQSYLSKKINGNRWGATNDFETAKQYFEQFPRAGIGVACRESGFFVVEADTPAGHNVDGIAALQQLIGQHGPLPQTLMAESPTGSLHRFFNYPAGLTIRNSTSAIAKGVDVKGDGGMVLVPPTMRPGVGQYKWLNNVPLADAPEWLLALLTSAYSAAPQSAAHSTTYYEIDSDVPHWFTGAAAALKNEGLDWENWNLRGMAIFAADNSAQGFAAFDAFSRKSTKYNYQRTIERWSAFEKCPPTRMTAGKLHYLADQDEPEWRQRFETNNAPQKTKNQRNDNKKQLTLIRVADIEPRRLEWLWYERLPALGTAKRPDAKSLD
jgi:Bifunctional DNA primase/polymerase, N-terminal/Primase C terminal 2 (PriCT-2)